MRVVKAGQHATVALCPKGSPATAAAGARAASLHALHSGSAGQGAAAVRSALQGGSQAAQPALAPVAPAQAGAADKGLVAEAPAPAIQQAPAVMPAEAGVADCGDEAEVPAQAVQQVPAAAVPEQAEAADGAGRAEPPAVAAALQQVPASRVPAVDRSVLDFRIHCCSAAGRTRAAPDQTGWTVPAAARAAPCRAEVRASDAGREEAAPGQSGRAVPAAAGASPAAAAAAQISAERASDAAWALQAGLISPDHPSQAGSTPLSQASGLVQGAGSEAGMAPTAGGGPAPLAAALQFAVAGPAPKEENTHDESAVPTASALLEDGSGAVASPRPAAHEAAAPLAAVLRGAAACPLQTPDDAPAPVSPALRAAVPAPNATAGGGGSGVPLPMPAALRGASDAVMCPAPAVGAKASSTGALVLPSSPDAALAGSFEDRPRQGQAAVACSPPNWRKVSTVNACRP